MADRSSSGADKASASRSSAESSAGLVIRDAGRNVVSGREARHFHCRFKASTASSSHFDGRTPLFCYALMTLVTGNVAGSHRREQGSSRQVEDIPRQAEAPTGAEGSDS